MEVNYLVALVSGLASFFAPCVIPLMPAYIGYVAGVSLEEIDRKEGKTGRRVVLSAVAYVLGFSLIFVLLGTSASLLTRLVRGYEVWIQRAGGIMVMIFAMSFLGWVKIPALMLEKKRQLPDWTKKLGYGRAFLVGVVFATAWTPCVGPVLGAILTLAAASKTIVQGATLLFVYSLGISIPFLLVALGLAKATDVVKSVRYLPALGKVAGIMLLVIGFLLFNNSIGLLSKNLTYDALNAWIFQWRYLLGFK